MFRRVSRYIAYFKAKKQWRNKNRHNGTDIVHAVDYKFVEVGNYTYGALRVLNNGDKSKLKIGHFCSIADNVVFILNAEHRIDTISTFPFKVRMLDNAQTEAESKGDIIVADDVWIGQNAIIMSGVCIGQGAVVAAGAVVTKDVPPYAIVGGNPAKIIKYRFSDELIEELLKIDYSRLTKELVDEHIGELYEKLESYEQLDWMPKNES